MSWQAARNGFPGDANAVNKAAQINQLLTSHAENHIYQGSRIIICGAYDDFHQNLSTTPRMFLVDQPFALPIGQTTVGRVTLPVTPVGAGADLAVSLWTDNAGVPGSRIVGCRIPAGWFTAQAASIGLDTATGALQTSAANNLLPGPITVTPWRPPATSAIGFANAVTGVSSGNYFIGAGGTDSVTNAYLPTVFTVRCTGTGTIGNPVLQPSLPQGENGMAMAATPDTVAVAGGWTSSTTGTANAYAAGWDANTGTVSTWTTQTPLPQAVVNTGGAATAQTMYVVGGNAVSGGATLSTVYYTSIGGGQLGQTWNAGPALPVAVQLPVVAVVGDVLLVTGGQLAGGAFNSTTYYAPIASGGTISQWHTAPTAMPVPVSDTAFAAIPDVGVVTAGGFTTGSAVTGVVQTLTASGRNGCGYWQAGTAGVTQAGFPAAVFPRGNGVWDFFVLFNSNYWTFPVYSVPSISVPLPATGLTAGATYHLLMQELGEDNNNYLQWDLAQTTLPSPLRSPMTGPASWQTFLSGGFAIPIDVFSLDGTGPLWHTYEDSGARITTLVNRNMIGPTLIGALESTQFADGTSLADAWSVTYTANLATQVTPL